MILNLKKKTFYKLYKRTKIKSRIAKKERFFHVFPFAKKNLMALQLNGKRNRLEVLIINQIIK